MRRILSHIIQTHDGYLCSEFEIAQVYRGMEVNASHRRHRHEELDVREAC